MISLLQIRQSRSRGAANVSNRPEQPPHRPPQLADGEMENMAEALADDEDFAKCDELIDAEEESLDADDDLADLLDSPDSTTGANTIKMATSDIDRLSEEISNVCGERPDPEESELRLEYLRCVCPRKSKNASYIWLGKRFRQVAILIVHTVPKYYQENIKRLDSYYMRVLDLIFDAALKAEANDLTGTPFTAQTLRWLQANADPKIRNSLHSFLLNTHVRSLRCRAALGEPDSQRLFENPRVIAADCWSKSHSQRPRYISFAWSEQGAAR